MVRVAAWAISVCLVACAPMALAQQFPIRPVHIIVPYPPGGGTDTLGRIVGRKLNERWEQPVVIENRAGGDGVIGVHRASRAQADGYTVALIIQTHAVLPSLKRRLPYDLLRDFAPVIAFAELPLVIVANHALPVKSIRELVALAKARPGELDFAGAGIGGGAHLGGELFNHLAGIKMTYIPYKGTGPALVDLAGGHVQLMFAGVSGAMPYVQSGKLRPLAVTSSKRVRVLPDVPTVIESGVRDYEVTIWYGMVVRAGTPLTVIDRLASDINAVIGATDTAQAFANQGAQVIYKGPAEFRAFLDREIKRWGMVVKQANIPIDDK